MFLLARGWGWQPSEFWNATLPEWFLEFDMQRPKQTGDFAGNLTQGDVDRLSALIEDD
jgi:hypothetical protein